MPDGIAEYGGGERQLAATLGRALCSCAANGLPPWQGVHHGLCMDRSLWAVVPVKDLQHAKQRLAGVLAAAERQALFAAMLEDVLAALAASAGLAGMLVVTRDPRAQVLAARYGARVLVEPPTAATPPPARSAPRPSRWTAPRACCSCRPTCR